MIPSPHENHQGAGPHMPLLPRRVRPTGGPGRALPALPQAAVMTDGVAQGAVTSAKSPRPIIPAAFRVVRGEGHRYFLLRSVPVSAYSRTICLKEKR